ncbi:uncharacterized protein G2W53_024817 [Senna tora]|uniref:Uncharacterized protein n=1 Tax=Senna tora TaxID=362788 RepID=A0A834TE79_9FABA|nr:uncharacterized protein G2W53_024817 [Senna tora]
MGEAMVHKFPDQRILINGSKTRKQ